MRFGWLQNSVSVSDVVQISQQVHAIRQAIDGVRHGTDGSRYVKQEIECLAK